LELLGGLGVELQEFVGGAAAAFVGDVGAAGDGGDGRAERAWGVGDAIGPAALGADDVGERIVEGAEADLEAAVELVVGELAGVLEEEARGPGVVGEEDVEGVVGEGGHTEPPAPGRISGAVDRMAEFWHTGRIVLVAP
jgi:hypothetical protein